MRFIFKVLIGMIVFSAFLHILTNEFGGNAGKDINETDPGYDINSSDFAWNLVFTGGGIAVVAGLASIFTKNVAWFGAGAIMAIIFALYGVALAPVENLFIPYPFARNIWNIFIIVFGIIATIAVVEIFTGRSVDD